MSRIRIAVMMISALVLSDLSLESLWAAEAPDVAVRAIFLAKCAACHGSDLAKPEGRFGYVLDLSRIAANPEMVIPASPEESELWLLIQHGEMPPSDSADGPLSEAEKEAVREWIASGARASSVDAIGTAEVADASVNPSNVEASTDTLKSGSSMPVDDRVAIHFLIVAGVLGPVTTWLARCRRSLLRP